MEVGKRHEVICDGSSDELSRLRAGYYAPDALRDKGGSARGGGAISEQGSGGKMLAAKIELSCVRLESQL